MSLADIFETNFKNYLSSQFLSDKQISGLTFLATDINYFIVLIGWACFQGKNVNMTRKEFLFILKKNQI